jgi:hypothetical protein
MLSLSSVLRSYSSRPYIFHLLYKPESFGPVCFGYLETLEALVGYYFLCYYSLVAEGAGYGELGAASPVHIAHFHLLLHKCIRSNEHKRNFIILHLTYHEVSLLKFLNHR